MQTNQVCIIVLRKLSSAHIALHPQLPEKRNPLFSAQFTGISQPTKSNYIYFFLQRIVLIHHLQDLYALFSQQQVWKRSSLYVSTHPKYVASTRPQDDEPRCTHLSRTNRKCSQLPHLQRPAIDSHIIDPTPVSSLSCFLISFLYCSFTVGKTSLITRFMYDSFDNTYQVRKFTFLLQIQQ